MKLMILVAGALALAACDPSTPRPTGSGEVVQDVTRAGIEGLTDAANVYRGAAEVTELLVRKGYFSREQLLLIQKINNRAQTLIFAANTGLTIEQRIAELDSISNLLVEIVGGKSGH